MVDCRLIPSTKTWSGGVARGAPATLLGQICGNDSLKCCYSNCNHIINFLAIFSMFSSGLDFLDC